VTLYTTNTTAFVLGSGLKKGISIIFLKWYPNHTHSINIQTRSSMHKPTHLRVFSGSDATSIQQLQVAIQNFISITPGAVELLTTEYHTNRSIRTKELVDTFRNPDDLIDWLMGADIFIIASQGIWLGLSTSTAAIRDGWSVARITQALKRLSESSTVGFPSGSQFLDPVWSGDKFQYIDLLQPDWLSIPTMKIDMARICDVPVDGTLGVQIFQ
jgi:hypothetical protein